MQRTPFFLGGSVAGAACLLMFMATGCGGGRTETVTRQIKTADAAPPDEEPDAEQIEEEGDAIEAPADDAQAAAETDAGEDNDAGAEIVDAAEEPTEPSDAGADSEVPGPSTPVNYLRPEDSPFAGVDFAYFYLEDFEDHLLNTPGLSSAGQLSSTFGAGVIDSVDGDDGIPDDNRCIKPDALCDAWWGAGSLTFTFDVEVLGALPTHVGGVWTDGLGEVSFEVFGADGESIYKVGPLSEPGFPDETVSSSSAEDRFFGAYHPDGISAFTLSNTQGGVEVDHVQYGRAR